MGSRLAKQKKKGGNYRKSSGKIVTYFKTRFSLSFFLVWSLIAHERSVCRNDKTEIEKQGYLEVTCKAGGNHTWLRFFGAPPWTNAAGMGCESRCRRSLISHGGPLSISQFRVRDGRPGPPAPFSPSHARGRIGSFPPSLSSWARGKPTSSTPVRDRCGFNVITKVFLSKDKKKPPKTD